MNNFELNYSNSEYAERHKNCTMEKPKQTPLNWHKWEDLFEFFKGYFNHFGDDISGLDEKTFERMVKTIWRFSHVVAYREGMAEQKANTPSFMKQLKDYFKEIQEHNNSEWEDTCKDLISPYDIWDGVLHLKFDEKNN